MSARAELAVRLVEAGPSAPAMRALARRSNFIDEQPSLVLLVHSSNSPVAADLLAVCETIRG